MNKFFLTLFVSSILISCNRTSNLNSDPNFSAYVGREYRTKVDLLVVEYADKKGEYVFDFPGESGLPQTGAITTVPMKLPDATVHLVLSAGSLLKISRIQKTSSIEWKMIDYYIDVENADPIKGKAVLALMITDMNAKPVPRLDSKWVEETVPRKN